MRPQSEYEELLHSSFSKITNTGCKPLNEEIQQRPRKEVRFVDYDDVFEILSLNDMTDEEFNDSYYTRDELEVIKEECMFLVCLMDKNETKRVRGLDHHTIEYTTWKREIQTLQYEAVLTAQSQLWLKGLHSPELIADICEKFSSEMVEVARIFAKYDATDSRRLER